MNGQTTHFTWDDEDRLTSQTFSDGRSDSYGYTGLGMRLTKSDPTGSYSYLADGIGETVAAARRFSSQMFAIRA